MVSDTTSSYVFNEKHIAKRDTGGTSFRKIHCTVTLPTPPTTYPSSLHDTTQRLRWGRVSVSTVSLLGGSSAPHDMAEETGVACTPSRTAT